MTDDEARQLEAKLVHRLRNGEQEALAEIYRRWGALVYSISLRNLGHHEDAEDVTQQVFVSAWRSRHTLRDGVGSLPGWLATITRRRCADHLDSRARLVQKEHRVATLAPPPTSSPSAEIVIDQYVLAQVLAELSEPVAAAIRLSVVEQLSHQEVADRLGLPLGTVKSHIRRGLLRLRAQLEEVQP